MAEARVYSCPACGGPTEEARRRCDYCLAPVATARCARCFHMNPPDARHCSGCGEALGGVPRANVSGNECPECKLPLLAIGCTNGTLLDCGKCGGQFVEHALLRALLLRSEVLAHALGGAPKPKNPLDQKIVYRPCPACGKLMHRKNFGTTSGIIIDACALHGSWFESGELPSVLAFVEAGGLQRARYAEVEKLRRERAALPPTSLTSERSTLNWGEEAVLGLLQFVASVLKR